MEEQRLRVCREGREAMQALAQLRDGDAALLYAFLAAQEEEGAALALAEQKLGLSKAALEKAAQLLLVWGLVSRRRATPPPRQEGAYPSAQLAEAREHDAAFHGLCCYLEGELGRILNRQELETLLSVRDSLNLPEDVLTLLISDCAGRGRLSARALEKQAYHWYDLELNTYEKASAYLQKQRERSTRGAKVLALFQIRDRLPGETEQNYIDKWTEWGLSDQLLQLAYDKTLLGAGRLSWPYLNKILTSWHEKGYRTPADIELDRKDAPPPRRSGETKESVESAVLRRMQEKRQARAMELEARRAALRQQSPAFAANESALRLCASQRSRASGEKRQALEGQYQACQKRQAELLAALGKPADWLADKPDCPYCGDRGYIGSKKCQCLLRACEEAKAGS